jgi:peptidoglycan/xylan/chitin deacetylase (PgdA/CDA1 family)
MSTYLHGKLVPDASSRHSAEKENIGPIRARILTYHEIEPLDSNYLYAVTARQLDEQLRILAERKRQSPIRTQRIEVTFDDGHVSNFNVARPLLERHGISATFFVTAGRIGQQSKAMTWLQLKTLVKQGHVVQSHGWSHKFLTHCSPNELDEELRRSKNELEARLGHAIDSISAPGGRWNLRVLRNAVEVGYSNFYLSDPWQKPFRKAGINVFGRLMIHNTLALPQFEHLLDLDLASWRWQRARGRLKDAVRTLLGDRLYHRIWCQLAVRGNTGKLQGNGAGQSDPA